MKLFNLFKSKKTSWEGAKRVVDNRVNTVANCLKLMELYPNKYDKIEKALDQAFGIKERVCHEIDCSYGECAGTCEASLHKYQAYEYKGVKLLEFDDGITIVFDGEPIKHTEVCIGYNSRITSVKFETYHIDMYGFFDIDAARRFIDDYKSYLV